MSHIMQVDAVNCFKTFTEFNPSVLFITADGRVSSSGWTAPRLSPRFYIAPPADGIWDFDFYADAPTGIVLPVLLPVSASTFTEAPSWLKGVRVHAQNNAIEQTSFDAAKATPAQPLQAAGQMKAAAGAMAAAIVTMDLAVYDDSFQPTGASKFDPWPHFEMKKLRHHLTLTVTGPDEAKIRSCINQAIGAGLIAAIAAAYATGGLGLSAATSAFLASLTSCLGNGFDARIDDRSHWIYWWT